jgi:hypothetical protein
MRKLSERIEEKLCMLPLRERELWAHYVDEVKVLERRLAEAEKILDKFFKTPADKWIVTEKYGLLYALGEVRDALRGETEGE